MNTTTQTEVKPQESKQVEIGNFGNGRYSKVMSELFRDANNYLSDIDPAKADRLCRSFGAELGRLQAAEVKEIKFGKLGKNGDINLREVCDSIKVIASPAISIAKILSILDDARKHGMSYKDTKVSLNEGLTQWLNEKPSK